MLRRIPTEASTTTTLVPPYDTSGSGIPVSGAIPTTAARFSAAWPQTRTVSPVATYLPNGSRHESAILVAAYANTTYARISAESPKSPSSSPMIAPIMSVCASGR
jgi:hypothetical protein